MRNPYLRVKNLSKRFGGVQALSGVELDVCEGEVLALIGENGAGKSTIVKILTGNHQPDAGEIQLGGKPYRFARPKDAAKAGISAVQQEPSMFDDLSVAENIFVGAQPITGRLGLVDWRAMRAKAVELLAAIGADIAPDLPLKQLSVAERHMVSLARALSTDARVIIFDEPTAALSQAEIRHLYEIIGQLRAQGKAIIFISHKFDEIFQICDRYVVMRDGAPVGSGAMADVTQNQLIKLMVGRTLEGIYPKTTAPIGAEVLRVENFSHPTEFDGISFSLHAGEILGFYGLVGAGRSEVMEALFGLKPRSGGALFIDGQKVTINSAAQAMAAGLAYVPEDRQKHGAILPFSILKNMSLPQLENVRRKGMLDAGRERKLADEFGKRVSIKADGWEQLVSQLSGGNQQKVVIGKWLATNPRVVILDEPTKGIDVGSKAAVHETIGALVKQGLAVILVTSELEEALGISDRLIVMARGKIVGRINRETFSSEAVLAAASQTTDSLT